MLSHHHEPQLPQHELPGDERRYIKLQTYATVALALIALIYCLWEIIIFFIEEKSDHRPSVQFVVNDSETLRAINEVERFLDRDTTTHAEFDELVQARDRLHGELEEMHSLLAKAQTVNIGFLTMFAVLTPPALILCLVLLSGWQTKRVNRGAESLALQLNLSKEIERMIALTAWSSQLLQRHTGIIISSLWTMVAVLVTWPDEIKWAGVVIIVSTFVIMFRWWTWMIFAMDFMEISRHYLVSRRRRGYWRVTARMYMGIMHGTFCIFLILMLTGSFYYFS